MPTISFSGIGSSIDFGKITDAIVSANSTPLNLLSAKRTDINNRIAKLKELNGKLITLNTAAEALTDPTLGTGRIASAADASILTATATDAAQLGSANITINRLATSLSQSSRSYAAATAPVLAGGTTTATFQLRKGGAATGPEITIDSTNDSLSGLRDAINAAGAGITASIVDLNGDGASQQLVLNSTATGAAGRVELVETTATGTGSDLGLQNLNLPTNNFNDLNASLTINGLALSRSSNTVSDAVAGVTLSLKRAGTSSLSVSQNTNAISEKLSAFVDAYNGLQDFVAGQYKPDSSGKPTGALVGDPTLRSAQQQLRDVIGGFSTNNGGTLSNLTQLGIGRDETGKLKLDTSVLNERTDASLVDVRALLYGKTSANKGIAQSILGVTRSLSDNITGAVQSAINAYTNSVTQIGKSMDFQQARLEAMRASLNRQFSAADAAINQLNNQGSSVSNILKGLNSNQ